MRHLDDQRDRPPRASGVYVTYAIRRPWIGRFLYYHETAPHWRSTPPLPGHRLSREETRRLAREVGGRVVRFTTRAERLGRLVEAAQAVLDAGGGRAGRYELREALRPFVCGSRPNPGIGAGKVPCHDDDGETVCPCVRVKGMLRHVDANMGRITEHEPFFDAPPNT